MHPAWNPRTLSGLITTDLGLTFDCRLLKHPSGAKGTAMMYGSYARLPLDTSVVTEIWATRSTASKRYASSSCLLVVD